jgi:hypothetical protein
MLIDKIQNIFFEKDDSPKRCTNCLETKFIRQHGVEDFVYGTPHDIIKCSKCGEEVGAIDPVTQEWSCFYSDYFRFRIGAALFALGAILGITGLLFTPIILSLIL